jgi:hypothetical protein
LGSLRPRNEYMANVSMNTANNNKNGMDMINSIRNRKFKIANTVYLPK